MAKRGSRKIGHYSFLAGVVIAILAGILTNRIQPPELVTLLLLALGLIVGFLNIPAKEVTEFLIAGIALQLIAVPSGVLETIPVWGSYAGKILLNISTFVSFAVLVVALKAIWSLAEAE